MSNRLVLGMEVQNWHRFIVRRSGSVRPLEEPRYRAARGVFHRHVKGQWRWSDSVYDYTGGFLGLVIWVEDARDAMTIRLYLPDHEYFGPLTKRTPVT